MELSKRKTRNPELEVLRKSVVPENNEELINDLIKKTSQIHAAYLFEGIWKKTFQKLCLCLSACKSSYNAAGWEEFGIHLGLNSLLIKCLNYNFKAQDPTYNILLAFVQYEDATLSKVIIALKRMKRFDVISIMHNQFLGMAEEILKSDADNEETGYFSISDSFSDLDDTETNNRNLIKRPHIIPSAPFIFQNIDQNRFLSQSNTWIQSGQDEENVQTASILTTHNRSKNKRKYGKKVLLTFASDGLDTAQQVAEMFRRKREDLPSIGVLILDEHVAIFNKDPEQFITDSFRQVDYVVPIITNEYLHAVSVNEPITCSSVTCMDTRYIKFIYRLMSTHYLKNGCINDKIRCVVPDRFVYLTQRHPIMSGPLFQVWVRASETEELSQRILQSRF